MAICAAILLVGAVVILRGPSREQQPVYQQRTLTDYWEARQRAEHRQATSFADPALLKDAKASSEQAIDALGETAVPYLVEALRHPKRGLAGRLNRLLRDIPHVAWRFPEETYYGHLALDSFRVLGSKAKSAIPELEDMLGEQGMANTVTRALSHIMPDAFPILLSAAQSTNADVRGAALNAIADVRHVVRSNALPVARTLLLSTNFLDVDHRDILVPTFRELDGEAIRFYSQLLRTPVELGRLDQAAFALAQYGNDGLGYLLSRLPSTNKHVNSTHLAGLSLWAELKSKSVLDDPETHRVGLKPLFNLKSLGLAWVQHEQQPNYAPQKAIVPILTNLVTYGDLNETNLLLALEVLERFGDSDRISDDCLNHVASDHPSAEVRAKAGTLRRLLIGQQASP